MNEVICKLEIGLQVIGGLLKAKEIILVTVLGGFRHPGKCDCPYCDVHYYLRHHFCGDSVKLPFKWVLRLCLHCVWNPDLNHWLLYCKATTSVLPPHQVLGCSQANVPNSAFALLILTETEEKKRTWELSGVLSLLFLLLITSLLCDWYPSIIS